MPQLPQAPALPCRVGRFRPLVEAIFKFKGDHFHLQAEAICRVGRSRLQAEATFKDGLFRPQAEATSRDGLFHLQVEVIRNSVNL